MRGLSNCIVVSGLLGSTRPPLCRQSRKEAASQLSALSAGITTAAALASLAFCAAAHPPALFASPSAAFCPNVPALIDGLAAQRAKDQAWFKSLGCIELPAGSLRIVTISPGGPGLWRARAYPEPDK